MGDHFGGGSFGGGSFGGGPFGAVDSYVEYKSTSGGGGSGGGGDDDGGCGDFGIGCGCVLVSVLGLLLISQIAKGIFSIVFS